MSVRLGFVCHLYDAPCASVFVAAPKDTVLCASNSLTLTARISDTIEDVDKILITGVRRSKQVF